MVAAGTIPTSHTSQGEIIMTSNSTTDGAVLPLSHDEQGNVRVNVFFPDYNIQKCFTFDPDENIWDNKRMVLEEFSEQLYDPLNYGLYLPPTGGKAGKFLDEERPLDDYKLQGPIGQLEFKYKRRVYRISNLNYRKLRQLHNKNTLKLFCDVVKSNSLDKVQKFVEKGLDPNYVDSDTGETPLTLATKVNRCRSLILQLVGGGAHLDFRNKRSLTAVHTAALNGNAEAIKALLELGASPNYKDHKGLTALYHLSKKRQTPALCAELLLRDYAHIGTKDEGGNTELHQTCKVGNYKVAEMLIFYGAELDYQSSTGATPLHVCAFNNELSCLQTLLVRGADKTMMNNARQTPFDVANISGNKDAANILDKHDDLLVVPFEESPMYNTNRRLNGANLEAMRLLSKSDPRINLSASVVNLATTDNLIFDGPRSSRTSDTMMRSELGHLVLSAGDDGMWEGKTGDKEGWFPQENVSEMQKRHTIGLDALDELEDMDHAPRFGRGTRSMSVDQAALSRQRSFNATFGQEPCKGEGVRTVVLARTKKGYGFVLRGAKAEQLRKLNVQFVPSEKMPALQYLDSVEKGSVSDKAGLRAGDFILEIDNKNVVHASHEQTVQIIKKAGDVLAMKVVRAVLSADGPSTNGGIPGSPQINGSHSNGGVMTGSLSLPAKPQKPGRDDAGSNSSGEVVMMRHKPGSDTNGIHTEEEQLAIDSYIDEQLDATLANYDSDSRSSGSGAIPNIVIREQKTASIRHRPSSSHFNSIQELDDMFAPPPPPAPPVVPVSQPALLDKNESRKPAKSRAKKFWNKGKSSKLGSGSKQLSLSQPNLAALDPDAEVKPITMYEMSLGHSVDAEGHMSGLPRTFSGDLSSLQRRKSESHASTTSPLPPPPPQFPAPFAPEDDRSSLHSGHSSASSNRTGSFQHHNSLSKSENHRFLPRTPLPSSSKSMSTELHNSSNFQSSGTLQRGKMPPPPPSRTSSYDSGVILTIPGHSAQHTVTAEVNNTPPFPAFNQSNSFSTPAPANHQPPSPEPSQPSNPFADAIRKAAANRNSTPPPPPAPVTNSNSSGASPSMGNELYAAVQKRQARTGGEGASDPPPPPADPKPAQNQGGSGAVSVEDQLRMAVANRRKLIERREPSTSESDTTRSHSVTPERTLSSNTPASEQQQQQPGVIKSDSTNFREMAEQKRLDFLRKKADSSPSKPSPVVNSNGPSSDSKADNNLTELQKVMNRLSVAKTAEDTTDSATEPNNNSQPPPPVHNKKKVPPPVVMKKPPKLSASSQSSVHDHLSPVEEFPPPPPPHEFGSPPPPHSGGSGSAEIIIPPPTFEMSPPNSFSPPIYTPPNKQEQHHHHHNDGDSHSVTSSVGSDTISSVSQDGNRLSVATSGYSSDPSRATKLSFSGKNVDSWTTSEVGDWLDAIGLGEYKGVFDENCIEGETLASMSKADIKELGVEKVGHRVKLDKEIKKLVGESPA